MHVGEGFNILISYAGAGTVLIVPSISFMGWLYGLVPSSNVNQKDRTELTSLSPHNLPLRHPNLLHHPPIIHRGQPPCRRRRSRLVSLPILLAS